MKPKILVSTGDWDPVNYVAAVAAAGGDPRAQYLAPGRPTGRRDGRWGEAPMTSLGYAGLLLAGGADVDPSCYGQENRGSVGIDLARDAAEFALLDAFCAAGKPVMGICRGHQVINVWLGGSLIQDLCPALAPVHGGKGGDKVHLILAGEGSLLRRLYGPEFAVNSSHHQSLDQIGRGLTVTARAPDGVVEAVEHDTLPLLGVQFHPERMTGAHARPDTVDGGAIFRAFLDLIEKA